MEGLVRSFKWLFKKDSWTISSFISFLVIYFILLLLHEFFFHNHKLLFLACILFSLIPFKIIEELVAQLLQNKNKKMTIGYAILIFAIATGISTFYL